VAKAVAVAAEMGVWMLNVHASGGYKMLVGAREALDFFGEERPLLIGVTLLTSFCPSDLVAVGVADTPEAHVLRLALLAKDAGLDGVVCSAREVAMLRGKCGDKFCFVTPGIRRNQDKKNDQERTQTPREAIANGSDFLVMGRPITEAKYPMGVICSIYKSI
jgi:orotidine-5'-phosphate decarboxylase